MRLGDEKALALGDETPPRAEPARPVEEGGLTCLLRVRLARAVRIDDERRGPAGVVARRRVDEHLTRLASDVDGAPAIGARGDRHHVLVRHQADALGLGIAAGPGVEQAQTTHHLAPERRVQQRVACRQVRLQDLELVGVEPRVRDDHGDACILHGLA